MVSTSLPQVKSGNGTQAMVIRFNFVDIKKKWLGKLSPIHSFTIVNGNDKFCQHFDEADKFIKENLKKHGIKVEYGSKLVAIDQQNQTATFANIATKERDVRPYNNLYALPPSKPHSSLVDAGLLNAQSNWQLDVDHKTLRHNKYPNIFGLGDINNLPTTKSFWGGFHQLHVVRHNLLQSLQGKELTAEYSGYSKSAMQLGQNSMTYVEHYYDQKASLLNMLGKNGGLISKIRYYYWGKAQKRKFLGYYLFKTWGPPTFKFKKTFPKGKIIEKPKAPEALDAPVKSSV